MTNKKEIGELLKKKSGSDFFEFLNHSKNYITAEITHFVIFFILLYIHIKLIDRNKTHNFRKNSFAVIHFLTLFDEVKMKKL